MITRFEKNLLITLITFYFSAMNVFATNIPAGNVSGHWTLAGSPYLVQGNITIPQDSVLQIDEGVNIQFQGHYQLHVLGRILAYGGSGNLITFSAVNDWWGIRFDGIQSSQDSSIFILCNIEKGNANGTGAFAYGGAFYISNFSKVRVEFCTIANNTATYGGGFYLDHANPKIYSNMIHDNISTSYYGGGIYCESSSPSIVNNVIMNNGGQIDCRNYSSPDIIGNTISNSSGQGIGCQYSSNPSIINNIISYNSLGIVLVGCSANIIGNIITHNNGNSYGSGIFSYGTASPNIINNTIAYNTATQYGGGICLNGNNTPFIKNTILWGNYAPNNQGEQISLQTSAVPVFYNCDIEGGISKIYYSDAPATFTGTYINNIDSNPLFTNDVGNDFSLQANSPCINAGDTVSVSMPNNDFSGNPRICENVIEIGAFEFCTTGIDKGPVNFIHTTAYPVPAHNSLAIEFNRFDFQENLELLLINTYGEISKRIFIGDSKTIIQLDQMNAGVYFYQLKNQSRVLSSGKFIVE